MTKQKRRTYVTSEQVLEILGSERPKRIIGKWYRGSDVRCQDCKDSAARFLDVVPAGPALSFRLWCSCGAMFEGTFWRVQEPVGRKAFFHIDCWFSRGCFRTRRARRKVRALLQAGR